MASLSRKAQLQQFSWQVLEDLVFFSKRWPRLSELTAQVLVEQQSHNHIGIKCADESSERLPAEAMASSISSMLITRLTPG